MLLSSSSQATRRLAVVSSTSRFLHRLTDAEGLLIPFAVDRLTACFARGHPLSNLRIIVCNFGHRRLIVQVAEVLGHQAVASEELFHCRLIELGTHDDRNARLDGRQRNRATANVDLLDDVGGTKFLLDGQFEVVRVHDDETRTTKTQPAQIILIFFDPKPGQDHGEEHLVEGLDPTTELRLTAGDFFDAGDRDAELAQGVQSSTCGDEFRAVFPGEDKFVQMGLVGNRQNDRKTAEGLPVNSQTMETFHDGCEE